MQEVEYLDLLQEEIVLQDRIKHQAEISRVEVVRGILMTLTVDQDLTIIDHQQDRVDLITLEVRLEALALEVV